MKKLDNDLKGCVAIKRDPLVVVVMRGEKRERMLDIVSENSVGRSGIDGCGEFSYFVPNAFGGGRKFSPTGENVGLNPTSLFTKNRFVTIGVDTPKMMPLCSCKCNACAKNINLMLEKTESVEKILKSFMSKRNVRPSRNILSLYASTDKHRIKKISKALERLEEREERGLPNLLLLR